MLIISAIIREYILKFNIPNIVIVINLIKIPDVLIKVHLFTLFIPINIVDSGASR